MGPRDPTRRSILAAAAELFVAYGYFATTIAAIADHAGVAVQTVYVGFGNKRELLRRLIEATIVGDDDVPITERSEARAIAAEPDPRRRAELDAARSRSITERVAPIVRVAGEASTSDPELAAMMAAVKAARRHEMIVSARMVAGADGLRVSDEEAAATLYVLFSPSRRHAHGRLRLVARALRAVARPDDPRRRDRRRVCVGVDRPVTNRPPRSTMTGTRTMTRGGSVLFHITQVHTPENCPRDQGGSNSLYDESVPGVSLVGRYGANAQHTLFLIVDADDVNAIHKFLWPAFTKCTSTITPVSEVPVPKE